MIGSLNNAYNNNQPVSTEFQLNIMHITLIHAACMEQCSKCMHALLLIESRVKLACLKWTYITAPIVCTTYIHAHSYSQRLLNCWWQSWHSFNTYHISTKGSLAINDNQTKRLSIYIYLPVAAPAIPPRFALSWRLSLLNEGSEGCIHGGTNSPSIGQPLLWTSTSPCNAGDPLQGFRFLPDGSLQQVDSGLCVVPNSTDTNNPVEGSELVLSDSCNSPFEYTACGDSLRHRSSKLCWRTKYHTIDQINAIPIALSQQCNDDWAVFLPYIDPRPPGEKLTQCQSVYSLTWVYIFSSVIYMLRICNICRTLPRSAVVC
jgi:hypothetical protein